MYLVSPNYLSFSILSFIFVNGPEALYLNSGCLRCVSGMIVSPVNTNLIIITFIFYSLKTKYHPIIVSFLKDALTLNWLNSPLASGFFINLDFLLVHTAHFNKSIYFTLLVFETLCFLLSVFSLHFKYYVTLSYSFNRFYTSVLSFHILYLILLECFIDPNPFAVFY